LGRTSDSWGRARGWLATWQLTASLALVACGPPDAALGDPAAPDQQGLNRTAARGVATGEQPAPLAPKTAPAAAGGKLNVIVLTIDALRADMPWSGYKRDIAPNLTKLERESVSYSRAYALSSYTAMSMGGFLAGRYPGELKRSGYFFSAYPAEEHFFPEMLKERGIRTLAAHAHFYFAEKAGFQQGFDDYRMVPGISTDNKTDRNITSPEHLALAIQMLSDPKNVSGQFFAWFHFMDPHDRYRKHDEFTRWGTGQRDLYDGEVAFTDHHVGKLLAFIKSQPWGARTAIVVSSDHGEAFGEHDMTRHGFELWENLVHVPLFFHVPGQKARRIDTPRSHIDLAPTIFALLGLESPPTFHGRDLLPEISGKAEAEAREVIVDLPRTSDNDRRRAMVHGRHKLISFGDDFRYELYDVVADPGETKDLRKDEPELFKELKRRYLERVKHIKDICPEMRHRLRLKRPEREC
jgi:arylsulfatase A-like enzyme